MMTNKTLSKLLRDHAVRPWRVWILALTVLMCILVMVRIWSAMLVRQDTRAALIPEVEIIRATRATAGQHIVLPGNITAWHEAPIYARTNGYLQQWYVDIGAVVKQGDLLATIETPELDAQLRQAEADLQMMMAKSSLAEITADRWQYLLKSDSVSKQATDEKTHLRDALLANVMAARANRDRLAELVSFERVIAPFSGIISYRGTDIGDLINRGSDSQAKPLFRIVQADPLRLYIKVPEIYATQIKAKMTVTLSLDEYPGQTFQARLLRTADAINPSTRTLLAEFKISNHQHLLFPGSYSKVDLLLPANATRIILPVNTLIFRSQGLQVATIDDHNRVILKNVSIAVDYGPYVELHDGVKAMDRVIINPSDAIYQGQVVMVHPQVASGEQT